MEVAPRKTLQQLAIEAAQSQNADPWACPRCGCKDWRVAGTYVRNGKRRRQRVCRHCHQTLITYEVPVQPGFKLEIVRSSVENQSDEIDDQSIPRVHVYGDLQSKS